jgi:hypothetical protein
MMLFRQGGPNDGMLEAETARLTRLATDMERVLEGILPQAIVTEEPPLFDRWILGNTLASCLVGFSTGHPTLVGVNRAIATSNVWLMSDDMTWARTLSRWYRLGRPAERTNLNA